MIELTFPKETKELMSSEECDIYHYWYFLNYSFKFEMSATDVMIY